ncbi:MAG TPA: preprotein translocase subunit SecE [Actinomycetaceae bacterium]|nr:preprotein translocase subunit SecE [Actinomycetaceae bacterium]
MSESASGAARKPVGGRPAKKRGVFGRLALFIRQIIAELKKVVRPSRNELWTYFIVVSVFVLAAMAYTGVLDFIFGQLVLFVFGA